MAWTMFTKSSSVSTLKGGIRVPRVARATPWGFIMWYSVSTAVLVLGTSTANFLRWP